MPDVLKSLAGGVARFALAWLLPTAVAVGLFWAVCVPALASERLLDSLTGAAHQPLASRSLAEALSIAAFSTFAMAIILAYASQLIYRVLEGYHLPRGLDRRWTGRQRRRQAELLALKAALERTHNGRSSKSYGLTLERLGLYPHSPELVMPTRLGNALRTLEGYGQDRYGLDSQQFWFELVGTADEAMRRESEEMRSQVDLFVAGVAVSAILSVASAIVALLVTDSGGPGLLALGAAALTPIAYKGAVRNMKDWVNSVRAMINVGRFGIADRMGLELPWKLEHERRMWEAASGVLHYRDETWRPWLDFFRRGTPYADADGRLRDIPSGTAGDEMIPPSEETLAQ